MTVPSISPPATLSLRCPRCREPLSDGGCCSGCDTHFPSQSVGSTRVRDFLLATRPSSPCHCPHCTEESRCRIALEELRLPETVARPTHAKAKILDLFRHRRGALILDAGCREGPIVHNLAAANQIVGVDLCPRRMLVDTPNALDKGYRELWIADAASLPAGNEQFDIVIATDLLEHVLAPERLLQEFRRVLKPGGHLLVSVPNLVSYNNRLSIGAGSGVGIEIHLLLRGRNPVNPISGARYPDQKQHLRFFTLRSLARTVTDCGFTVERAWGFDPVLSRIPLADRLLRNLCSLSVVVARAQE